MINLKSIIEILSPCSVAEILDYIESNLFLLKGRFVKDVIDEKKLRYSLEKLLKKDRYMYKFKCSSGFKIRYGFSKYSGFLKNEPRFLHTKGKITRCLFCGMPVYQLGDKKYHFPSYCPRNISSSNTSEIIIFRFGKNKWAIISKTYIHGILDSLESAKLRLPDRNKDSTYSYRSELWLINELARNLGYIEKNTILPVLAEESIIK